MHVGPFLLTQRLLPKLARNPAVIFVSSGIVALLAIHARGSDPIPAARALWREFEGARGALVGLLVLQR